MVREWEGQLSEGKDGQLDCKWGEKEGSLHSKGMRERECMEWRGSRSEKVTMKGW